MSNPWSQQSSESNKAYQAFLFYLEERARTQFDAYLAYCEWNWDRARREAAKETTNEPPGWFKRWPSQYDWAARRRAYYADVDERVLSELMESKARRKVERVELLDDLKGVVSELGVDFLRDKLSQGELGVNEFVSLIDRLLRNYRDELNDLPDQRHSHDVEEGAAERLAKALGVDFDDTE